MGSVYRFLLAPRWIALMLVGLVLVVLFTIAGFWQLGKFQSPAPGAAPDAVSTAASDPQNLGYALQWWVFAGAVIFFGIKVVRMEAHDRLAPVEDPPALPPIEPAGESDAARP